MPYCTKYAFLHLRYPTVRNMHFFLELINNLVTEKSLYAVVCIHFHNHLTDSVDSFSISSAPKLLQEIGVSAVAQW